MKKLILIGGVPGTGKTTLAYQTAIEQHIDKVVSVDILKGVYQLYHTKDEKPYLYTTTHEAYQLEHTDVITGYIRHCDCMQDLLFDYIPYLMNDEVAIMEGAQLTPSFLDKLASYDFKTEYIHISLDKHELLTRYAEKSKMRTYGWKENIDSILLIQDYLNSECELFETKKHGGNYEILHL